MCVLGGGSSALAHKNLLNLPVTSNNTSSYHGTQGMIIFLFRMYSPPDTRKPCLYTSAWQQCTTNSTWAMLTHTIRRLQLQTSTADDLSSVILQVCTAPNSQLSWVSLFWLQHVHKKYRHLAWPHSFWETCSPCCGLVWIKLVHWLHSSSKEKICNISGY